MSSTLVAPDEGKGVIYKLPVEVFSVILQFLEGDYQSLLSLTRASKAFAAETNKILHRHVTHWPTNRKRHTKFLNSITASPELAKAVHSYSIKVMTTDLDPFFNLLHRGLKAMVNLQHLSIEDLVVSHYKPNTHLTAVLEDCKFRLKTFNWTCRCDEQPIAKFLATQVELEALVIHWHSTWRLRILPEMCVDVPTSTCPRLRRLCGEIGTLKMFLPGRNIGHVSCPPPSGTPMGEIEDAIPLLSEELGKIKYLCCSIYYAGSFLFSYLQRLEVLHLVGFLVDENVERIPLLSNIRVVILQGRSILSGEITETEFMLDQIPHRLFPRCKRLERVDVLCRPECQEPHQRWSRWVKDAGNKEGFSLSPIHPNDAVLTYPFSWIQNTGF